ncbi:MAG: electron transfer flavoprotein subunit beta/FixA family protein [Nitrospinae bacterium]|nr:electron transfer flavoprotein subunit beta/FixA family protein [Nitrospinota bacterium]MBF0634632.1 electron transfer flavoprotein subunit beta/FixA family protein [Nitrospinota bacterium]
MGGYRMVALVKQVPDTSTKAGVNPDGTVDRARAKRMLNPFDKFGLQKAIEVKNAHGGEIIAITMGPPPAIEILVEALEYGADRCYLLTDRRLAASDTLATAYALHKAVQYVGPADIVFTGLQTTDGDTAQTGPQIAERLNLPQVTYCERLEIKDGKAKARRVVEGGHQWLEAPLPILITVANSASKLEHKRFANVHKVKELLRNKEEMSKRIFTIDLDVIGAESGRTGLVGSPTVVGKTWKLGEIGGSCHMLSGDSPTHNVEHLMLKLKEDNRGVEELIQ